ncbi:MAG: hypothetical protein JNK45_11640 [Myxococcales bacterium]|nr:hypothetical protein [Myxococcales bacterium]
MARLAYASMIPMVAALACGTDLRSDDDGQTATLPSSMTAQTDESAGDVTSNTGGPADSSSDGSADGGTKLDVGAGTGNMSAGEGGDMSGCDKVDFLFIVDNSGSMGDEQSNLINSFPTFISTIQETLDEAQDYHIMVLDSDAYVFSQCEFLCPVAFNTCIGNPDYECGVTQPMECEDVLGAGVTYPRGGQASNEDCDFATGARYMDSNQPDLAATFECAAKVGIGSTDDPEKPMEAMVAAVTPNTPAAACNEGFIRDDAILVVTFITDEDDAPGDSGGTVEGWRAALIAAKGGDEQAVVVLGLFGDGDQPGAICPPFNPDAASGAEPSPRLRQFVDSWGDRGIAGSICAENYEPFFQDAVSVIDTTCDEFVPPAG